MKQNDILNYPDIEIDELATLSGCNTDRIKVITDELENYLGLSK